MDSGSHNAFFKYRGELGALFFLLLMVVFIFMYKASYPTMDPSLAKGISIGLIGLGALIRFHIVGFAPARTSGRNKGRQVADRLITSGMYSQMRHPLYLANSLLWIGVVLWTGYLLLALLAVTYAFSMYRSIIKTEDQFLAEKFGQIHAQWKAKTPAIIPKFRHYTSPDTSFNLSKALYREKNGWVGIVLAIALIDAIQVYIVSDHCSFVIFEPHLLVVGLAIIYYVILKVMYKYTAVLQRVDS